MRVFSIELEYIDLRRITEASWTMVNGQEEFATEVADKLFSSYLLNPQEPDSHLNTESNEGSGNRHRRVLFEHSRHPDHDCIHHFNLQIAQQLKGTFLGMGLRAHLKG